MERLKLPSSFIQLIANLFTDRENEVFTAVGTTPFYKVLTGIDQGEVMSPLLWCIYLDPLLCEIQQHRQQLQTTCSLCPRLHFYRDGIACHADER